MGDQTRNSVPRHPHQNTTHGNTDIDDAMSKFGVLVMGPAGAGKSTFCSPLITHLRNNRRSCFYVNLDTAAEDFTHEPWISIFVRHICWRRRLWLIGRNSLRA